MKRLPLATGCAKLGQYDCFEYPTYEMKLREILQCAALLSFISLSGCISVPEPEYPTAISASTLVHADDPALVDDLERRTFDYFWQTVNPSNGLIPDRYPTPSFSSIAAVGFALTAYTIGIERGYISREQGSARTLITLKFFHDAPQGPESRGRSGFRGFFYHFLDMQNGSRYRNTELSTIDTALLISGALTSAAYFDSSDPTEVKIRTLADDLYRKVDWNWASHDDGGVAMGWNPETGLMQKSWLGFNEGMLIYLLGLGSPTHPLTDSSWQLWTTTYEKNWRFEFGQNYLAYPTLFVHQFTPVWVDLRGIKDAFMRAKGIDYFENARRATYANRGYAIANPKYWSAFSANLWGLTASDGPGLAYRPHGGKIRRFLGYAGRGIALFDDGTLAPNGAIGSLPFAPEIVLPAIAEMRNRYGGYLYSTYGFRDSFNPSFSWLPKTGKFVPRLGWFDVDYVGIDQGLIIGMVENYRSGLIWKLMRDNPYLRRGLLRAGFTGGWLESKK